MTEQQKPQTDSIEKVYFSKWGSLGYVSGKRVPVSFRMDSGIAEEFKRVSKATYGSTCRAVETLAVSLIETVHNGVHFSNTDKLIQIDKIVIERNLRPRRNLEFVEEKSRCHYCGRQSCGEFVYLKTGEAFRLCKFHANEFVNGKTWGVKK